VSQIPRQLARRLDALAVRAHRFHRLAHHPLCRAYAGEVVRIGRRTLVCRGCALLAVGALTGLISGAILRPGWPSAASPSSLLAPLVLLAVVGLAPRRGRPRPRLLTRWLPMWLAGAVVAWGLRAGAAAGFGSALVAAAVVVAGTLYYRRRGPDRTACLDCPQAPPGPRCDGFRRMLRRERAMSRLGGRWLRAAGLVGAGLARGGDEPGLSARTE
jgi:hypothetical protein